MLQPNKTIFFALNHQRTAVWELSSPTRHKEPDCVCKLLISNTTQRSFSNYDYKHILWLSSHKIVRRCYGVTKLWPTCSPLMIFMVSKELLRIDTWGEYIFKITKSGLLSPKNTQNSCHLKVILTCYLAMQKFTSGNSCNKVWETESERQNEKETCIMMCFPLMHDSISITQAYLDRI